jgi:hypothetical protein
MYAGHFAAGLALHGRAPRVPVAVLLIGSFLLDLLWIALGITHLDKTDWDGWSHSLVMSIFWATLFARLVLALGAKGRWRGMARSHLPLRVGLDHTRSDLLSE